MARTVKFADLPPSHRFDDRNDDNEMPSAILPSTYPNDSPFLLKIQDVEILAQSEGFSILRHHLAEHYTCYEYVQ